MNDQALDARIRRLAPSVNDSDWLDVVERSRPSAISGAARIPRPPTSERVRRLPGWPRHFVAGGALIVIGAAAGLAAILITARVPPADTTRPPCCASTRGESPSEAYKAFLKAHPQAAARIRQRQTDYARLASRSVPGSTGVRTLVAYTHVERPIDASSLPASVRELIGNQLIFVTGDAEPVGIEEPVKGDASAGTPSIYLVRYPNNLCVVISIKGAAAGCYAALRAGRGSISFDESIVDGKRYIHGLVANNVTSVAITLDSTSASPAATIHARIVNNVFIADLPYKGEFHLGALTITITHTNGAMVTLHFP